MKKYIMLLIIMLNIILFAENQVQTYDTKEYYVIAVSVAYNDIDQIMKKGSLVIQDDHGRFYKYNPGSTNFYSAVSYGHTDIDQSKLDYLDVDNMQELIEVSRKENTYVLPLNEALEIIENNK